MDNHLTNSYSTKYLSSIKNIVDLLMKGERIYFMGLDGNKKWMEAITNDLGVTLRFGSIEENKFTAKRWYPNGWTQIKNEYLYQFDYE